MSNRPEPRHNVGRARGFSFLIVALLVGSYYRWEVRSAGYDFQWNRQDLNGYYNLLARGMAHGRLHLDLEPSPELLAQPDPWSPGVDDSLRLFDAVLFNRHYYLYHGVGPAIMLFLPYRLLTGNDLPENYALWLFCFAGYLFSAGTVVSLIRPPPVLFALMLLAIGLCQGVPFLLSRVWVYEVAVGAGYFCLSAAFFFLVRRRLIPAGVMFGMAVACRPHFILAGVIVLAVTIFTDRTRALAFAIPFAIVGLCIATYNYERFANPIEFGTSYMLTGANMGKVHLSGANMPAGLYYELAAAPQFSPVFPWVRIHWPARDVARPAGYIVEPVIGALWLAPFIVLGLLSLPAALFAGPAIAILLFIAATGWSTQRYEVDFLPLLILAALVSTATRFPRAALPLLAPFIVFGVVVNMAIGFSGPLDEMLKNRPARYVKIARWFSPVARYRPELNPAFDLTVAVQPGPARQDLVRAGLFYELYVETRLGRPTLVSHAQDSMVTQEIHSPVLHISYLAGDLRVTSAGGDLLTHHIGALVAAPSQIVTVPALAVLPASPAIRP